MRPPSKWMGLQVVARSFDMLLLSKKCGGSFGKWGIFLGYDQRAGGGWSGDLYVADWEEIENAENFNEIYKKRFKASEVDTIKIDGEYRFPLSEGLLKQPEVELSRMKRRRHRRKKTAGSDPLQGNQEGDDGDENLLEEVGEQPIPPQDHVRGGARKTGDQSLSEDDSDSDFWTLTNDTLTRHHKIPRQHSH